jgi:hypothetical protein
MADEFRKLGADLEKANEEHQDRVLRLLEGPVGDAWIKDRIEKACITVTSSRAYMRGKGCEASRPLPAGGAIGLLDADNSDVALQLAARFVRALIGICDNDKFPSGDVVADVDRRMRSAACALVFRRLRDAADLDGGVKEALSRLATEFLAEEVHGS